jgi:hypothetical protein
MKNKVFLFVLVVMVGISMLACSMSNLTSGDNNNENNSTTVDVPENNGSSVNEPEIESTATTEIEDESPSESESIDPKLLFKDDFSNDKTGWDIYEGEDMTTGYENDMFVILNNAPQYYTYAYANKNLSDTSIVVESTLLSGPMDVESGIICRSNYENFYYAVVSIDGFYGIAKSIGDDYEYIQSDGMYENAAINLGNEMNTIRFDCIGNELTLYVNGQLLSSVTDDQLTNGDIGLLVGTYDEGDAKFGFDNLVVTKP